MKSVADLTPSEARALIRKNEWIKPTSGMARGYAQANLAILPKELAFDFLLFCQRNPKPCPVLDVTEIGSPIPELVAPGADIRTDIPKYRVYKEGQLVDEVTDILHLWDDNMVAFLLGCSFSFEHALMNNDISIRHIEQGCNVPMFKTNIQCQKAGPFKGPTVVSMRPVKEKDVIRAVQVTSRFPAVHGAPVHIGNPEAIGIKDINSPDFGDSVKINPGEVPVFWACGVTPQAIAMEIKPKFMITHAPGYMFITDKKDEDYGVI